MQEILPILLFFFFLFLIIDGYAFSGLRHFVKTHSQRKRYTFYIAHWVLSFLSFAGMASYFILPSDLYPMYIRVLIMGIVFMILISKLFFIVFLLLDDIRRGILLISGKINDLMATRKKKNDEDSTGGEGITRSEFLMKVGLIAAAIPFTTMSFGILSGAHDYRVIRQRVVLPNLPRAFDGIRILQLSDIHAGSFYNRRAVTGGIEMAMAEKADIAVFTGDLVNYDPAEMKNWTTQFSKIKAPLGMYSVLGNHDYGLYGRQDDPQKQKEKFRKMIRLHDTLGWDLLMNENRLIKVDNEQIALIGVENWGLPQMMVQYADLAKAKTGTEDIPLKLLLSHDPTHFDLQVTDNHQEIDLTLSGHTHGFQFGVETDNFQWSPSQYIYRFWAGLYQKENQQIYVNRGFGYLAYPGRIGMPPEITVLELVGRG